MQFSADRSLLGSAPLVVVQTKLAGTEPEGGWDSLWAQSVSTLELADPLGETPDRASANVAVDQERRSRRAPDPLGYLRTPLLTTRAVGVILQMRADRSEFGQPHQIDVHRMNFRFPEVTRPLRASRSFRQSMKDCPVLFPGLHTLRADMLPHRQASSLLAAHTLGPCFSGRCAAASTR